jgi:hypothetical protein
MSLIAWSPWTTDHEGFPNRSPKMSGTFSSPIWSNKMNNRKGADSGIANLGLRTLEFGPINSWLHPNDNFLKKMTRVAK